jgi:hypothetical protein
VEKYDEGSELGEKDLRQMQDRETPRSGARDLPQPQAQAATGLMGMRVSSQNEKTIWRIESWHAS